MHDYELYTEKDLDTTDMTRTKVRKSLTGVEERFLGDTNAIVTQLQIPHAGFCTKRENRGVKGGGYT